MLRVRGSVIMSAAKIRRVRFGDAGRPNGAEEIRSARQIRSALEARSRDAPTAIRRGIDLIGSGHASAWFTTAGPEAQGK
jgi:hypothetical protein